MLLICIVCAHNFSCLWRSAPKSKWRWILKYTSGNFLQSLCLIYVRLTITPPTPPPRRGLVMGSRRSRHTVFPVRQELMGRCESGLSLPPFAWALVTLRSLAHRGRPSGPAYDTRSHPLNYPQNSWFPGLVLTAAWFIFACVSHRALFRRSVSPRRVQHVCMLHVCMFLCVSGSCILLSHWVDLSGLYWLPYGEDAHLTLPPQPSPSPSPRPLCKRRYSTEITRPRSFVYQCLNMRLNWGLSFRVHMQDSTVSTLGCSAVTWRAAVYPSTARLS